MQNVHVDPEHLRDLALEQEAVAREAKGAAGAADGTSTNCWVTHGLISGASNVTVVGLEAARKAAGEAISRAALDLAGLIPTAAAAYGGVDSDLSRNINQQIRSE